MRKLPFFISGILILLIFISAYSFNNSDSLEVSEQPEVVHDTIYITDSYELDEDFYNSYHPDSVSITIPEGFTYYTDYEVRKYGRFRSQLTYALGIMLPEASYPHGSQIAKWVIKRVEDDKAFREDFDKKPSKIRYNGNLFNGAEVFGSNGNPCACVKIRGVEVLNFKTMRIAWSSGR